MARDRQRAKQRRARRDAQNPGPPPSEPHRSDVPGELDHASGSVDQFDAALVAGAGGMPAGPDDDGDDLDDGEPDGRYAAAVADEAEEEPLDDEELEEAAERAAPAVRRAEAAPERRGGIGRFGAFLRASWAELQRVQWPDRRQVAQATAVVLGFVVVAGAYLGLADQVAEQVVDLII